MNELLSCDLVWRTVCYKINLSSFVFILWWHRSDGVPYFYVGWSCLVWRRFSCAELYHSGPEGSLSQQKLIIYMSYIFKKVMKNAIQIHWNQNRALREFNVMDNYFHLYHGYPQWILRIWEVFPLLYSRLKNYPHSVIHIMKGIIEAYLKM